MPLLLILVLVLPFILTLADATNKRFEEAAPMVMMGLALLLYLLGLCSMLWVAVWLVWLMWGACVIYVVLVLVKVLQKRLTRPKWVTVGAVLFLAAAAVLWWVCRGRQYANWDEYSHWGRAVKAVYSQDAFISVTDFADGYKEYPPGLAPLQALMMRTGFMDFRADVAIYVQGLFSASLLLYPLRRCGWKNKFSAVGLAALLLLVPTMVFWNYYTETTVDGLLGVLFAFVLLVHYLGEKGWFERALMCMGCAMLPLVKSSGMLLAAFAIIIILIDEARSRRACPVVDGRKTGFVPTWAARLSPAFSALAAMLSWQIFIAANNVPRRWSGTFSLADVWEFITGSGPAWRYQTAKSYFANIFTDTNYGWPAGFMPYMGFFLVFIGVFLFTRLAVAPERRAAYTTGFWLLFGAGVLYVLLVLCNYLFIFTEYEAVRLASLSRYLNTYIVAMTVYQTGWLGYALPRHRVVHQLPAMMAALVLWLVLGQPNVVLDTLIFAPVRAGETININNRYVSAANTIKAVDTDDEARVYIIAIDDVGEVGLRVGYELLPQALPDHLSNISPGYDTTGELLLANPTPGEWAAQLAESYDYVYLFEIKGSFAADYGELFEDPAAIADGNIFQVVQTTGGVVLRQVPV